MSDLATLNRSVQLSSAATDFFQYARARACGNGAGEALRLAQARGASPRVLEMLQKGAVSAGSLEGTWGAELAVVEAASTGFLSLLPPHTAFDRLVSDHATTPLPLYNRLAFASSGVVASYVGEGAMKPLSAMSINAKTMPLQKVVAMIAFTVELLRTNAGRINTLFDTMLRNAVAQETDTRFLQILTESTGVPSVASTGTTAADFLHDVNVALQGIDIRAGSRLYLIAPTREFNTLALLRDAGGPLIANGMLGNIKVIPTSAESSSGVPVTDAVLLDASST